MFKCIKTFAGNKVSMKKGDIIEYLDKELAEDYLRAGFIIEEKVNKVETKVKELETEVKEVVKEAVEEVIKKPAAKKPIKKKK